MGPRRVLGLGTDAPSLSLREHRPMGNASDWPDHLRAGAVRFARPTAHFDECRVFYAEHLGLPVLASWRGHDGYDGVVFGLPDSAVQLELT